MVSWHAEQGAAIHPPRREPRAAGGTPGRGLGCRAADSYKDFRASKFRVAACRLPTAGKSWVPGRAAARAADSESGTGPPRINSKFKLDQQTPSRPCLVRERAG